MGKIWTSLFIILIISSWTPSGLAFSARFEGIDNKGVSTDVSVSYTEDINEAEALAEEAINAPSDKPHFVITASETDELPVAIDVVKPPEVITEYDLDETLEDTHKESLGEELFDERKMVVLAATAQSVASTFSFVYFSEGPIEAAAIASLVCAALNFYFSHDPAAWGRFLEWGEGKTKAFLSKLGLKRFSMQPNTATYSRLLTGAAGAVGFSFLYGGILAWDSFLSQALDPAFLGATAVNGLIASFFTGVWDSAFVQWQKNEETRVSESELRHVWRAKNLFSAFLTPLVYLGLMPAKIVAVSSGVAATLSLWKPINSGKIFRRTVEFSKDSIKKLFQAAKTGHTRAMNACARALTLL